VIAVDLSGRSAVVTGGTRGLGRAIAEALARAGADVFVTHRWGSVGEAELLAAFAAAGLAGPTVVECSANDREATRELMRRVAERGRPLHAVVSNVALAKVVGDLSDLRRASLDLSVAHSAWPVVDLLQAAREALGTLPPYVVGISSEGGTRSCHPGYDLAGASKAALETLCRYLAVRLKPCGVRVNVMVAGLLDTPTFADTFGEEAAASVRRRAGAMFLDPARVAAACLALCSGLMDAMTGQAIVVDEGWSLLSPLTYVASPSLDWFRFPGDGEAG
jgi:NAD(P)-dependent dehydrogenase (short-subunit alcohol dehydrogenase family)